MTILEATNNLFKWFEKYDYFNTEENYKELFPNRVSESKEADIAATECALNELVKDNVLRFHLDGKNKHWILVQPLSQFTQNVPISYDCGMILSQIAEHLSELTGNKELLVKADSISEKDILIIVSALSNLLKNKTTE